MQPSEQTETCPQCGGSGMDVLSFDPPLYCRCPVCEGTGRVPKPGETSEESYDAN